MKLAFTRVIKIFILLIAEGLKYDRVHIVAEGNLQYFDSKSDVFYINDDGERIKLSQTEMPLYSNSILVLHLDETGNLRYDDTRMQFYLYNFD